ncbi:putative thioesterase family protein [Talaromyces proteolyticus]|uniref:Thioesterase family protein n=1 Tax=Talaromyces proteolyticus TaxID=1131652 RepID=A0AAD4KFT9_9EURO|nr:putative thioesterase family protein [Talaromyces proteolyticus]KAH8691348.1 putative thioesterase family protein [Talaromyces proteolyticus]
MASGTRELDDFELDVQGFMHSIQNKTPGEGQAYWDIDQNRANVRLESASKGPPARVTYRLTVTPQMRNSMDSLHGGCAATIIDNLSTTILMAVSKPGMFQYGGVSRNLNVTYLRPLPLNTDMRLICEVVQMGRRLALLKAEIRRVDDDALCVVADHQKANTDPEADQKL